MELEPSEPLLEAYTEEEEGKEEGEDSTIEEDMVCRVVIKIPRLYSRTSQ